MRSGGELMGDALTGTAAASRYLKESYYAEPGDPLIGYEPERPSAKQLEAEIDASPTAQMGKEIRAGAREAFPGNPRYNDEWLAGKIPGGVGSTLPTLALSAIPFVGPVLGSLAYGTSSGQQGRQEALDAGHPESAETVFGLDALAGAATEYGLGAAVKAPRIFRDAAKTEAQIARELTAREAAQAAREAGKSTVRKATEEGLHAGGHETFQEGSEQAWQNEVARLMIPLGEYSRTWAKMP
jgi:hypothetical protein